MSVCLSVRPSVYNNPTPTGQIFMKFDILVFSEKFAEKIQVSLNLYPAKVENIVSS